MPEIMLTQAIYMGEGGKSEIIFIEEGLLLKPFP